MSVSLCQFRLQSTSQYIPVQNECNWYLQDLFVAHVGDSGAFCIRDGAARRLTIDHKPTNPAEQKRIANAGGKVSSLFRNG